MSETFKLAYDILQSPKRYIWKPKPDITTYELALCMPVFSSRGAVNKYIDALPPEAKRHWEVAE